MLLFFCLLADADFRGEARDWSSNGIQAMRRVASLEQLVRSFTFP